MGRKYITAATVARVCADMVGEADIFVGIVGDSPGAHYELGLAHGMKKPILLLVPSEVPDSYIASGIAREDRYVLRVRIEAMSKIRNALRSEEVMMFLRRHIPVEGE